MPDSSRDGWLDWAEWVEPVELSLAAVTGSVLGERLARLYTLSAPPALTHVVVVVDVGVPTDADAASHLVRVATMAELRSHFPFVDAVAALSPTRYAVLARRHPGLEGTIRSLEGRLRGDSARIDGVAILWCEPVPETAEDVPMFVRGLRVKPRTERQPERGTLAAGLPVELLAGGDTRAAASRRHRGWAVRSAAAAVATAVLASGAGAAAALGTAAVPWRPRPAAAPEPAPATTGDRLDAGAGILTLFAPAAPPALVEELARVDAVETPGEDAAVEPAPTPTDDGAPVAPVPEAGAPEPPPVPEGPGAPEAPAPPETPAAPEAPEPPDPEMPATSEPPGLQLPGVELVGDLLSPG